jgi:hypothetical protein
VQAEDFDEEKFWEIRSGYEHWRAFSAIPFGESRKRERRGNMRQFCRYASLKLFVWRGCANFCGNVERVVHDVDTRMLDLKIAFRACGMFP